jgi:HSP20 family protein
MARDLDKTRASPETPSAWLDPFGAMRSEMNRVLDSFLGGDSERFTALARNGTRQLATPRVDVRENPDEIVVEAELPGIDEKDVTVTLDAGILRISGEKKIEREEKKDDYHLTERSYGSFRRTFRVGDSIDETKVAANFDKGVLTVKLPKRPGATKTERRIPIGKA